MTLSGPEQLPNGRWISNGRKAAISCLDAMMGEKKNIQILAVALQKQFELNPIKFFQEIVMPLCPKQMLIPDNTDNDAETQAHRLRLALAEMEATTSPPVISISEPTDFEASRPSAEVESVARPSAVPPNRMSATQDQVV